MSISTLPEPGLDDRVIVRLRGEPGPTLLCVAGLHGNEPAGVEALRRVGARLESPSPRLRGELLGLVGNRRALAEGRRFLAEDLNRIWTEERVAQVQQAPGELAAEETELLLLYADLAAALERARGTVYLLDLHTTSGPGPAFAILDDTLPNREFAMHLPVPIVLGIEEELDGTLAGFLLARGVVTVGFECGMHDDPESPARGEAAIWIALEASGVLPRGSYPEVEEARRRLADQDPSLPRVVETRYRHPVTPWQGFRARPGLESFQPVTAGETISVGSEGPIRTPEKGRILMPLYQEQGEDGFFIVRDVEPFWLRLSALLRRLRIERILHWLPGVRRHPARSHAFIVDRRVARWYALELLHLLGFRRHGDLGDLLEVSRRQMRPPGRAAS